MKNSILFCAALIACVQLQAQTSPTGANPTATVGLSPVNGSATTFMRSDAAPPLSQSITPVWTGLHAFTNSIVTNKIGVGAATTSSGMDPSVLSYMTRTDSPSGGVGLLQHNFYAMSFGPTSINTALLGDVYNTGNAVSTQGGHLLGVIGRAQDTTAGQLPMYGVEGKYVRSGTTDYGAGVWAISDLNNSTPSGRIVTAFDGFCEVYNGVPQSPVGQGTTIVYHATKPTGGDQALMYSFASDATGTAYGLQLFNQGPIIAGSSLGNGAKLTLLDDGTDGNISVNTGALRISTPGNYLVYQQGNGLVPFSDGAPLGISGHSWSLTANAVATQQLAVSGNAAVQGNLTVTGTISAANFSGTTAFQSIDTTGNVGIGTTTPNNATHLSGSVLDIGDTGNQGAVVLGNSSGGSLFSLQNNNLTGSNSGLNISAVGAPGLTILSNGNVGIGTTNPTQTLAVNGTMMEQAFTIPTGNSAMAEFLYSGPAVPGNVGFALTGLTHNTGTTVTGPTDHLVGALGWAMDEPGSACNMIGVEGKVDGKGSIPSAALATHGPMSYVGLSGDAGYTGSNSSFNGTTLYGVCITRLQATTNGLPPDGNPTSSTTNMLNTGKLIGFYCPPLITGATKYTLFGSNDLAIANASIKALDASQTKLTRIFHDGANGHLEANGNLIIGSVDGGAVLVSAGGMVPATDGAMLGIAGSTPLRWAIDATTGIFSGNVGIGTTTPDQKLSVNGKIHTQEVIVDMNGWSDYVFKPAYKLASLGEIESAIKSEGHLPGIPSAQEVAEHGVSVGQMQAKLLAKVEELTLLMIQQDKQMQQQNRELQLLKEDNATMRARLDGMAKQ